jgi:serine/threonine protein phosphatase PrpC
MFTFDYCINIGDRLTNDDYIYYDEYENKFICMVIDGHGGSTCAELFLYYFKKNFKYINENITNYLFNLFDKLSKLLLSKKITSGICVSGVYMNKNIYLFHIGDTKIYMYKNNKLIYESDQHDLSNHNEIKRCFKNIKNIDIPRLEGKLTVTRALGNIDIVSLYRKPTITKLYEKDYDTIILCSDGIYKKMKVYPNMKSNSIISYCLKNPPNDNMSIIIIKKSNNIIDVINKI